MCFQYPRAGSRLLLLSPGAGTVSRTAWCWWKWICHLLYGRLWKRTEPISFAHSCLLHSVLMESTLVIDIIQGPPALIVYIILAVAKCSFLHCCIVFHVLVTSQKSLTQYTFRLELDKYVQGLHSSLQTPEVLYYCNNSVMKLYIHHYIINAILICLCVCVSCRTLRRRCVPIWVGGTRSLWCTFIGWCSWSRATSASCCMPWVLFHC